MAQAVAELNPLDDVGQPIPAVELAPFGIHPERIEKLMVSTNILPGWAEKAGLATRDRLESGLRDWREQGGGKFL